MLTQSKLEKKYYISGLRPVVREIYTDYEMYYSYQWETGVFKQDMSYLDKVYYDPDGDVEEITKDKFDAYVQELQSNLKA